MTDYWPKQVGKVWVTERSVGLWRHSGWTLEPMLCSDVLEQLLKLNKNIESYNNLTKFSGKMAIFKNLLPNVDHFVIINCSFTSIISASLPWTTSSNRPLKPFNEQSWSWEWATGLFWNCNYHLYFSNKKIAAVWWQINDINRPKRVQTSVNNGSEMLNILRWHRVAPMN